MISHHLSIEPCRTSGYQVIDQKQQGQFRRVRLPKKHALAAEQTAGIYAIQAAREFPFSIPCFNTMNDTIVVKLAVNTNEIVRDPRSATLAFAVRLCALANYCIEVAVD